MAADYVQCGTFPLTIRPACEIAKMRDSKYQWIRETICQSGAGSSLLVLTLTSACVCVCVCNFYLFFFLA